MNGSEAERPTVGVLAAVRRGGRILLLQRASRADAGLWGFPGGRLELGETLDECAMRELAEETGVRADPRYVLTTFDYIDVSPDARRKFHFVLVCILMDWRAGEGELLEPDQHTAIGWFTPEEVATRPMPVSARTVDLMRSALNGKSAGEKCG